MLLKNENVYKKQNPKKDIFTGSFFSFFFYFIGITLVLLQQKQDDMSC